jgi:hypothetical protein
VSNPDILANLALLRFTKVNVTGARLLEHPRQLLKIEPVDMFVRPLPIEINQAFEFGPHEPTSVPTMKCGLDTI